MDAGLGKKLSALIVEDDPSFALELEMLLEEIGYEVAGAVDNAADALELILTGQIDFILMDIDINGPKSGLDVGQEIAHLNIPVLFITGMSTSEHYESARKANFMGYLVKPVDKYTLRTAVVLAFDNLSRSGQNRIGTVSDLPAHEDYLYLLRHKVYEKVSKEDILLVEGASDYVKLKARSGQEYLLRKRMKAMEGLLSGRDFFRVHRSYLVNLKSVQSIDFNKNVLTVMNQVIPISRQKRKGLKEAIRELG